MKRLYTIKEVREIAKTNDIYRTKAGYVYKITNGIKEYIRINNKGYIDIRILGVIFYLLILFLFISKVGILIK